MKIKINLLSFILSFVCIALFFIAVSSREMIELFNNLLPTHPLNIILGICLVTLFLGTIGFSGISNWISLLRSIFTVIISAGLSVFIFFIIFIGNLYI
jgi:hypothetical protein